MAGRGIGEQGGKPLVVDSVDSGEWWCHLSLSGELDMESAQLVRQAVDDAVGRGRNRMLISAKDVTFIDSSALMVLLTARAQLLDGGGTLQLSDASPTVMRILEIAMLTDTLVVGPDEEPGEENR